MYLQLLNISRVAMSAYCQNLYAVFVAYKKLYFWLLEIEEALQWMEGVDMDM